VSKFKINRNVNANVKKPLPIIRTEWVDFNEVKLWSGNPRRNDKAVKDLALLLVQYGQRTPLSVWEKNYVIYKGNTTYKALKYLVNMPSSQFTKLIEKHKIKNPYKPEKVFIAVMNFTNKREAELYGMSDNKSGEWSDWDDELLAQLTQEYLKDVDTKNAFVMTGFKDRELSELMYSTGELPPELKKVDLIGTADSLKADYCIIEMPNKKTRLQFMEAIGVDHFRNRVITFENLEPILDSDFVFKMSNTDVGEVTYTPQKRNKEKKVESKQKKHFKFKVKSK